jgi:hypothetical protein
LTVIGIIAEPQAWCSGCQNSVKTECHAYNECPTKVTAFFSQNEWPIRFHFAFCVRNLFGKLVNLLVYNPWSC